MRCDPIRRRVYICAVGELRAVQQAANINCAPGCWYALAGEFQVIFMLAGCRPTANSTLSTIDGAGPGKSNRDVDDLWVDSAVMTGRIYSDAAFSRHEGCEGFVVCVTAKDVKASKRGLAIAGMGYY